MAQEVKKGKFEKFDASKYRVGIVAAQFNRDITEGILKESLETLSEYRVKDERLEIFKVPGCMEIPFALKVLAETKKFDCLVAIGAVVRGESAHFDYVAKMVTDGVLAVQLQNKIPVGFGVLTVLSHEQGLKRFYIGAEAVIAVLHNAKILKSLK